MQGFEKVLRISFATITAILMWQIHTRSEPWFESIFAGQPSFVVPGISIAMLILQIIVAWPLLRSTSER